jgi:hypothetical protein
MILATGHLKSIHRQQLTRIRSLAVRHYAARNELILNSAPTIAHVGSERAPDLDLRPPAGERFATTIHSTIVRSHHTSVVRNMLKYNHSDSRDSKRLSGIGRV